MSPTLRDQATELAKQFRSHLCQQPSEHGFYSNWGNLRPDEQAAHIAAFEALLATKQITLT